MTPPTIPHPQGRITHPTRQATRRPQRARRPLHREGHPSPRLRARHSISSAAPRHFCPSCHASTPPDLPEHGSSELTKPSIMMEVFHRWLATDCDPHLAGKRNGAQPHNFGKVHRAPSQRYSGGLPPASILRVLSLQHPWSHRDKRNKETSHLRSHGRSLASVGSLGSHLWEGDPCC